MKDNPEVTPENVFFPSTHNHNLEFTHYARGSMKYLYCLTHCFKKKKNLWETLKEIERLQKPPFL